MRLPDIGNDIEQNILLLYKSRKRKILNNNYIITSIINLGKGTPLLKT